MSGTRHSFTRNCRAGNRYPCRATRRSHIYRPMSSVTFWAGRDGKSGGEVAAHRRKRTAGDRRAQPGPRKLVTHKAAADQLPSMRGSAVLANFLSVSQGAPKARYMRSPPRSTVPVHPRPRWEEAAHAEVPRKPVEEVRRAAAERLSRGMKIVDRAFTRC